LKNFFLHQPLPAGELFSGKVQGKRSGIRKSCPRGGVKFLISGDGRTGEKFEADYSRCKVAREDRDVHPKGGEFFTEFVKGSSTLKKKKEALTEKEEWVRKTTLPTLTRGTLI